MSRPIKKEINMRKILFALVALVAILGIASAGGDFGGASADLGAAASCLGSLGADTIGGYGGSGSSTGSSSHSAAVAATNSNRGFVLSTPSGQVSMPSMADIEARISADLGQISSGSAAPTATPTTAVDAISSNLGHIASEPSSGVSMPAMTDVRASISGNLGSLAGGISSGSSGGGSSPSVSSPCAGVMTSSVPASAATYAAVHGESHDA